MHPFQWLSLHEHSITMEIEAPYRYQADLGVGVLPAGRLAGKHRREVGIGGGAAVFGNDRKIPGLGPGMEACYSDLCSS